MFLIFFIRDFHFMTIAILAVVGTYNSILYLIARWIRFTMAIKCISMHAVIGIKRQF